MIYTCIILLLPVSIFAAALADGLQPDPSYDIEENMDRISEGTQATRARLPYLALVEPSLESGGRTEICGGVLTAVDKVVTASYCVTDVSGAVIPAKVTLGIYDRESTTETTRRVRNVTVEQIQLSCDRLYAVLTLSPKVGLTNRIQTIPYAPTELTFIGTQGIASGWGIVASNETSFSSLPRFIPGRIVNNNVCKRSIVGVEDHNVCFNGRGTGGTCFGDTGGPLTGTASGATVLVGVALNRPRKLCGVDLPSVFVRVQEISACSSSEGV